MTVNDVDGGDVGRGWGGVLSSMESERWGRKKKRNIYFFLLNINSSPCEKLIEKSYCVNKIIIWVFVFLVGYIYIVINRILLVICTSQNHSYLYNIIFIFIFIKFYNFKNYELLFS
jgi:hypothetical protein